MHARATINSALVAEANEYEFVEGNVYFPVSAVVNRDDVLVEAASGRTSRCPWKGEAHYYDVKLGDGSVVRDAAWYYPQPFEKAAHIKDHLAFDKSKVHVEKDDAASAGGKHEHHGFMDKVKHVFKA